MNRRGIAEPTGEHHAGCGIRSRPIFPELRPILGDAFKLFGGKSDWWLRDWVVARPRVRPGHRMQSEGDYCGADGIRGRFHEIGQAVGDRRFVAFEAVVWDCFAIQLGRVGK